MSTLCKRRGQPHTTTLTADTTGKFRVSKTTLRFGNFLEGFTELTESHYTHSYGLLQRKNRGEHQPREASRKTSKCGALTVLSLCSHGWCSSPVLCVIVHRVLSAWEGQLTLLCPEFLLGLNHTLPAWLTFSLQLYMIPVVPAPLRQNWYSVALNPHCRSYLDCPWPKLSGKQRHLCQAEHSRGSGMTAQEHKAKPRPLFG